MNGIVSETFIYNLRRLMKREDVRVPKLSKDLGYNVQTVYHWLEGVAFPTCNALECICDYFGVEPCVLFLPMPKLFKE